jgi:hypothetical protein
MRKLIFWLSQKKSFTNPIGRAGLRSGFAQRYVAGNELEDGLRVAKELNDNGFPFLLNHLGELAAKRLTPPLKAIAPCCARSTNANLTALSPSSLPTWGWGSTRNSAAS